MPIDDIRLDIPGSTMRVGIADQYQDYAIRRHLVKGETTQALAQDALHTLLGGSWDEHHVIPNLPLQNEEITRFGKDKWFITQVFARRRGSAFRDGDGKRQSLRFSMHATDVFIASDQSKTNGLPYHADPEWQHWHLLPLTDLLTTGTVRQSASLPPVSYKYLRPACRLRDERTYATYPLTSGQIALMGKVNNGSITLNSVGLTFSANEVLFVGADFDMVSDGTTSGGRWQGAYYFDCIKGGHYMQQAYWDDTDEKWFVANTLLYDSGDFAAAF